MNLQDNATGFQHIGFPTNDLQETIAFYEKLGFSVALRTYNEEAGEAVAFLQLGNLMLEIYENHQASMQAGAWDHLAIDVKDIEAAYEEICALGLNNQKD
ncbi:VOC family protein, partial [Ruminococcus callidus]